jgi:hypothetical protein
MVIAWGTVDILIIGFVGLADSYLISKSLGRIFIIIFEGDGVFVAIAHIAHWQVDGVVVIFFVDDSGVVAVNRPRYGDREIPGDRVTLASLVLDSNVTGDSSPNVAIDRGAGNQKSCQQ